MSSPSEHPPRKLSHVDELGQARMVDVGSKPITSRTARSASRITMSEAAAESIRSQAVAKGDAISVARIAAIQAVKWTSHLIPLCHAIGIDGVEVEHDWIDSQTLEWRVMVRSTGRTGVEMESMTAASVAALAIYDMCKSIDPSMVIGQVRLLEKSGGQRGDYSRRE